MFNFSDVLIGITTYNRKNILMSMAYSLKLASGFNECDVVIFDDASSEYDKNFLNKLFPKSTIFINQFTIGADYNIHRVFNYFLETNKKILFMLDSDLIFNKNFIILGLKLIDKTDGILSLYNSFKHSYYKKITIGKEILLLKKTIGSAGVVFYKNIVDEIIKNVPPSRQFDWDWSFFLEKIGKKIFVTEKSYIQHIGYYGFNTKKIFEMDYGMNFTPTNFKDSQIIEKLFEKTIQEFYEYYKSLNNYYLLNKNDTVGRIFHFLVKLKRNMKK